MESLLPDAVDQTYLYIGFLDTISPDGVIGWVVDLFQPSKSVTVELLVDGVPASSALANMDRFDVRDAGMTAVNVGFHLGLPPAFCDNKPHSVTLRSSAGHILTLDDQHQISSSTWEICFPPRPVMAPTAAEAPATSHPDGICRHIYGNIDHIGPNGMSGWAIHGASDAPVELDLLIDGMPVAHFKCSVPRPDVQAAGEPRADVGFVMEVPDRFHDGLSHRLQFQTVGGALVQFGDGSGVVRHEWSFNFAKVGLRGQVDGTGDGAIRGWVFSSDRLTGRRTGGLDVLISWNGQPLTQIRADLFRADVGERYGCDPGCGFLYVPPPEMFASGSAEFRISVVGHDGYELANSPVRVEFPRSDMVEKLHGMLAAVDALFTQTWHLRQQIKSLIPAAPQNLHTYHEWAVAYHARLAAAYVGGPGLDGPLVSVICPTFRPRIGDFIAAVKSVQAQTYKNWELIIVDDASRSPELRAAIMDFAKSDPRIRWHLLEQNGGISKATNTALAMAEGQYVAFFDHDDLLAPPALEVMMRAALRTGAKVLYCDEDKIDDLGRYSEVHFKPAWNYRLLLAQNFVCHLLFVERTQLERAQLGRAGPLDSRYDGAQDHDLMLRLAEVTPASAIQHVPEVLYHWRKTPTSTAASGSTKTYAVAAGQRAIGDHLARRGLPASVRSQLGATLYDVEWQFTETPKVSIIIPYREQVGMTQQCVQALLKLTAYPDFEVVLVDNFSTSERAIAFANSFGQAGAERVRVIRVAERFNYSRLNNLAVASTDAPFLVFMNNDVVVQNPDWLKVLMGEALAAPDVGIVGSKLLYPSGHVQHGGVVLGVGGIADHAHRGLARDDPGYMARAISAHEISAVTAACMLCRKEAFDAVDGFDEIDLQVAFNDIDLCLKVGTKGWRVIMAPGCVAEHHESLSRGSDLAPDSQSRFFHENQVMAERWRHVIAEDRFYNPNFSQRSGIYRDLRPHDERPARV